MSSSELIRQVRANSREKETKTRESLKRDQHAWAHACSMILGLPALRLFVPTSSVAYTNPQALDISGNGLHLTNNNTSTFGYTGLVPHVTFDGTNQYLSYADTGASGAFDITGTETYVEAADKGLTLGGWFYITETGTQEAFISKWGAAGARAYLLYIQADDTLHFRFSDDGTNNSDAASAAITTFDRWYFVVGRVVPSATVDLFVNNNAKASTVTARASVHDNGTAFNIGARAGGSDPFDGKASLCFACAAQVPDATINALFSQTRRMFGV